jgi:zinc finger protein
MARPRVPIRGALFLHVALALALGGAMPAVAADTRDPRCAAWEAASAPPPGIDMATVCPPGEVTTVEVDLDREPLIPYVVGLVVMAAVLGVFGLIAMRVTAPRPDRRATRPEDWWACPSCGERNRPDRAHCFACQASRDVASGPPAAEGPHPA